MLFLRRPQRPIQQLPEVFDAIDFEEFLYHCEQAESERKEVTANMGKGTSLLTIADFIANRIV